MFCRAVVFYFLLAAGTAAKTSECLQAEALAADYWAMVNGLVQTLEACGDSMTTPCKIARATDKTITDREGPNGSALLIMLPIAVCKP
jgi:hypothetical protein